MRFDIESLERQLHEDQMRVASLDARLKANDALIRDAINLCVAHLTAPWRALAAHIREENVPVWYSSARHEKPPVTPEVRGTTGVSDKATGDT